MGKQKEQVREAKKGKGAQQSFPGEEEGRETLFQSGGVNRLLENLICVCVQFINCTVVFVKYTAEIFCILNSFKVIFDVIKRTYVLWFERMFLNAIVVGFLPYVEFFVFSFLNTEQFYHS